MPVPIQASILYSPNPYPNSRPKLCLAAVSLSLFLTLPLPYPTPAPALPYLCPYPTLRLPLPYPRPLALELHVAPLLCAPSALPPLAQLAGLATQLIARSAVAALADLGRGALTPTPGPNNRPNP